MKIMKILPKAPVIRCVKCHVLMSVNLPMIGSHLYARDIPTNQVFCNCVTKNCGKLLIKYDYNFRILRIDHVKSHEITTPPHILKNTYGPGVEAKPTNKPHIINYVKGHETKNPSHIVNNPYSPAVVDKTLNKSNVYKISPNTLEILKIADEVIRKTKSLMLFGASNQKNHYHDNPYNCSTTSRAAWSYGNHKTYDINKRKIIDNNQSHPLRAAAWALKAQAGTCDNINAIAYCLCKDMLSSNVKISLIVSLSPIGHCLVVVSALDNSFEDIAVDAWPIHARSVLWKHHFSYPNIHTVRKITTGILNCPHKKSRMEVLAQRCQNIPAPNFQNTHVCQPSFDYSFPTKDGLHNIVYAVYAG
ncbi:hypothetical protein [Allofrancisella frigidaquae]|uniref:Uncharacterized protein n=1 Tax=Allofrancisella frigidaquae TaxID=1085644 RepID=A0A6M3HRY9_9GAMM|nr:hypothetical protein [Allofrancisella frigidaquae]QIV94008.1 hypothetical protein E3E15_00990 [Allofrancisella frigidaquae]